LASQGKHQTSGQFVLLVQIRGYSWGHLIMKPTSDLVFWRGADQARQLLAGHWHFLGATRVKGTTAWYGISEWYAARYWVQALAELVVAGNGLHQHNGVRRQWDAENLLQRP